MFGRGPSGTGAQLHVYDSPSSPCLTLPLSFRKVVIPMPTVLSRIHKIEGKTEKKETCPLPVLAVGVLKEVTREEIIIYESISIKTAWTILLPSDVFLSAPSTM